MPSLFFMPVTRRFSESSVEPFHDAGDVYKAQKCDVELVKAGGHMAKDLHALGEVFHQVPRLVAVPVQDALAFCGSLWRG